MEGTTRHAGEVVTPTPRTEPELWLFVGWSALFGFGIITLAVVIIDSPLALVPAFIVLLLAAFTLMSVPVELTRSRRAHQASAAVVGQGAGPEVLVLPTWANPRLGLRAELWPVGGHAPLGQVKLGQIGPGFDPTVRFRVWGEPVIGRPVALTSVDGHQLVLAQTTLEAADPRGLPTPITAVLAELMGWPSRDRPPGGGQRDAAEAALAELRARQRRYTRIGAIVTAVQVVIVTPAAVLVDLSAGAFLSMFLLAAVGRAFTPWLTRPLDSCVQRVTGVPASLARQVRVAIVLSRPPPSSRAADGGR